MQAAQNDPSVQKQKKVGYSIAGSLSLFIHLGILLLIGGTVIIEQVIPKQTMTGEVTVAESIIDSPMEEQPEETPQDVPQPSDAEPQAQAAAAESSPFDMTTVVMDSPSPTFTIPPLGAASAVPGVAGTPGGSSSSSSTTGSPSAKKPINIFGAKTEAAKLGVILDCSGSAHAFLLPALKEIDKNFDNAPTVLAMGCGMGPTKEEVEVKIYGRMKLDPVKDKPDSRTILGQLASAEKKFKDLEKYLKTLQRRNDVWAIYGGDINATGFGFEQLMKEGVDTIYWFSDLADGLNAPMMEKLIEELKKKKIKVIVHNFSGKTVSGLALKMATETGGSAISTQIPK